MLGEAVVLRLSLITLRYFIYVDILDCGYDKIFCKWVLGSGPSYRIRPDESACNFGDQLLYPLTAIAWVVLVILRLNCIFSENAWICISLSFVCLICTLGRSIYKYVHFVLSLHTSYPYKIYHSISFSQNSWYTSLIGVFTTFRHFHLCAREYN